MRDRPGLPPTPCVVPRRSPIVDQYKAQSRGLVPAGKTSLTALTDFPPAIPTHTQLSRCRLRRCRDFISRLTPSQPLPQPPPGPELSGRSTSSCASKQSFRKVRNCAVITDRFPGGTSLSLRRAWFVRHTLRKLRDVPPRQRNPANRFSTLSKAPWQSLGPSGEFSRLEGRRRN